MFYIYIYIYICIYTHTHNVTLYVHRCIVLCCYVWWLFIYRFTVFTLVLCVPSSWSCTVSFHNFKSQNFKLSVSNPKNKHVAYLSVLSQISNCQGLGRKKELEMLKTYRIWSAARGSCLLLFYRWCSIALLVYYYGFTASFLLLCYCVLCVCVFAERLMLSSIVMIMLWL